jgi:hypothetical protein
MLPKAKANGVTAGTGQQPTIHKWRGVGFWLDARLRHMCVVYTRNLNRPSHDRKNISHSDGLAIQILSKLLLFIVSPKVPKKNLKTAAPISRSFSIWICRPASTLVSYQCLFKWKNEFKPPPEMDKTEK